MNLVFEIYLKRDGAGELRLVRTRFRDGITSSDNWTSELLGREAVDFEPEPEELIPDWDNPEKALVVLFLKSFAPGAELEYGLTGPDHQLAGPLFDAVRKEKDAKDQRTWLQRMFGLKKAKVPPDLFYREGSAGKSPFVRLGTQWKAATLRVFEDDKLVADNHYGLLRSEIEREKVERSPSLSASTTLSPTCGSRQPAMPRCRIDLPDTGEFCFGRDREIEIIDDSWKRGLPRVLGFIAWGGMGKTALLNAWLARMDVGNATHPPPDLRYGGALVFAWTFYSQGAREDVADASSHRFFAEALSFFGYQGSPIEDSYRKGVELAERVRQQRTILILDGLEPLQFGEYSPDWGKLKDKALAVLLKNLAADMDGLCIVTSREPLKDLSSFVQGDRYKEEKLERLTATAGGELLRRLGVRGRPNDLQIEHLVERFEGHPLALDLLGRYLVEFEDGNPACSECIPPLTQNATLGGHAFRVMERYDQVFHETGLVAERGLLRLLALFDRPAGEGLIGSLVSEPPLASVPDELRRLDEQGWQQTLLRLRRFGFLKGETNFRPQVPPTVTPFTSKTVDEALKKGNWSLGKDRRTASAGTRSLEVHPLVREHFAEKLNAESELEFRNSHVRVYEFLRDHTTAFPETLTEIEPLLRAVRHGCLAGIHEQVFGEVLDPRIYRGPARYLSERLGGCEADLAVLSGFFSKPWTEPVRSLKPELQGLLLNRAGIALSTVGRMEEADRAYLADSRIWTQCSYDIPELIQLTKVSSATALSLRSEVLRELGQLEEAEAAAKDAIKQLEDCILYLAAGPALDRMRVIRGQSFDAVIESLRVVDFAFSSDGQSFDFPNRFSSAWGRKAMAVHYQGRFDQARSAFERAEAPYRPRQFLANEAGVRFAMLLLDLGRVHDVSGHSN